MARMNEQVIQLSEELARTHFKINESFYLDSYSANLKKVKLVFSNETLIKISVELPYYLVESEMECQE